MVCTVCNNEIPRAADRCPHCGTPALYPNVRAAAAPEDVAALDQRYKETLEELESRGCTSVGEAFEKAASRSQAVICRPLVEVHRLVSSDRELYATYYQLTQAEVRVPTGDSWDTMRRVADSAFFPGYVENIRFAALSLDSNGLTNYGDCSLELRESMIAHRSSVLEQNSVTLLKGLGLPASELDRIPPGYRATWGDRGRLCLVKLASKLTRTAAQAGFPTLLLANGSSTADDDFVEVQIFGSFSMKAIEKVVLHHSKKKASNVVRKAVRLLLEKAGINVELR